MASFGEGAENSRPHPPIVTEDALPPSPNVDIVGDGALGPCCGKVVDTQWRGLGQGCVTGQGMVTEEPRQEVGSFVVAWRVNPRRPVVVEMQAERCSYRQRDTRCRLGQGSNGPLEALLADDV